MSGSANSLGGARVTCRVLRDALARFEGNKSKVARHLGITKNGLALKMKRLGIG